MKLMMTAVMALSCLFGGMQPIGQEKAVLTKEGAIANESVSIEIQDIKDVELQRFLYEQVDGRDRVSGATPVAEADGKLGRTELFVNKLMIDCSVYNIESFEGLEFFTCLTDITILHYQGEILDFSKMVFNSGVGTTELYMKEAKSLKSVKIQTHEDYSFFIEIEGGTTGVLDLSDVTNVRVFRLANINATEVLLSERDEPIVLSVSNAKNLTSLDLSSSVFLLSIYNVPLESLDFIPSELVYLNLLNTDITNVDTFLSKATKLEELVVAGNKLSQLNVPSDLLASLTFADLNWMSDDGLGESYASNTITLDAKKMTHGYELILDDLDVTMVSIAAGCNWRIQGNKIVLDKDELEPFRYYYKVKDEGKVYEFIDEYDTRPGYLGDEALRFTHLFVQADVRVVESSVQSPEIAPTKPSAPATGDSTNVIGLLFAVAIAGTLMFKKRKFN
ncbi:hypothetical protein A4S06_02880 [Erysipelotrichaceae bacterium MTC7]|nr:hypothetical protein A4S06_02880 [Erysipelotrichaceae bacterium MTC7]